MAASSVKESISAARFAFVGIGVFSGMINLLALTGSLYMLQVYDRVVPSKSVPTLIGFTVLMALLYVAFGALDYARMRVLSRIGLGIDRLLRERVLEAVLLLPLRVRQGLDGIQPVRDLDQIRSFLSGMGPTALFDMPWMPIYLALVYVLHPVLGLFATVAGIALIGLTALTEKRMRAPAKAAVQSGAARSAFGEAARRNAEVIPAMGLERRMMSQWHKLSGTFLGDQLALSDAAGGIGSFSKMLRMLLQSGILGLGAYLAIEGELSAGSIIAASIIMSRALAPIEIAIANWKGFIGLRESAKRLDGLLASLPAKGNIIDLPRPSRLLEVQNLTVAPPGQTLPTLVNVSFKLQAGEGLGVIGASAAGKSTLVRAIVGAWMPMPRGGYCTARRRHIRPMEPRSVGSRYWLSTSGHRAVRGHYRGKHCSSGSQPGRPGDRGGAVGGHPRHDRADAGRLSNPNRRRGAQTLRWSTPATRPGAGSVRRSIPCNFR